MLHTPLPSLTYWFSLTQRLNQCQKESETPIRTKAIFMPPVPFIVHASLKMADIHRTLPECKTLDRIDIFIKKYPAIRPIATRSFFIETPCNIITNCRIISIADYLIIAV